MINLKIINEKNILIFCLFSFFYCWGLSFYKFELRYLIFLPALIALYKIFKNKKFDFLKIPIIIFLILFLHLLINLFFFEINISLRKCFEITAVFLISLVIIYYIEIIKENLHSIIKIFIYSFPLIFVANLVYGYIIFSSGSGHIPLDGRLFFNCDNSLISFSRIFFKENSHLGMIAVPTILSIAYFKKSFFNKWFNLFFIFFLFFNFLFFSTTFLVGIFLSSLVITFYFIIRKNYSKLLVLLIFVVPTIFMMQHNTCDKKISETKNFLINNSNIFLENADEIKKHDHKMLNDKTKIETWPIFYNASSSVHFYSILLATYSVKKNYFGLGINNYSIAFDRYLDDLKSFNKFHDYVFIMNKTDGSNNLSKLIVEFGLFSFLLIPLFLRFLFSDQFEDYHKFYILSILITQLGRGAGYFNGGFLIGLLIMIIFSFKNKNVSKNKS